MLWKRSTRMMFFSPSCMAPLKLTTDVKYTFIYYTFPVYIVRISVHMYIDTAFIKAFITIPVLACLRTMLFKHWIDSVSELVQSGDTARFHGK